MKYQNNVQYLASFNSPYILFSLIALPYLPNLQKKEPQHKQEETSWLKMDQIWNTAWIWIQDSDVTIRLPNHMIVFPYPQGKEKQF